MKSKELNEKPSKRRRAVGWLAKGYPEYFRRPIEMPIEEWRTKWNIPNWETVADYPHYDNDLERDRWKWEFIRRNPHYRDLWESYQGDEEQLLHGWLHDDSDDLDLDKKNAATAYDLCDLYSPRILAQDIPDNSFDYSFRGSQMGWTYGATKAQPMDSKRIQTLRRDSRYAIFIFDMGFPIAAQVDRAHVALDILHAKASVKDAKEKDKHGNLISLLRLLDAYSEGVGVTDCVEILGINRLDGASRVNKDLRRALKMWQAL